jgi:hypothetical protein
MEYQICSTLFRIFNALVLRDTMLIISTLTHEDRNSKKYWSIQKINL